jgi:hypothetical protein
MRVLLIAAWFVQPPWFDRSLASEDYEANGEMQPETNT